MHPEVEEQAAFCVSAQNTNFYAEEQLFPLVYLNESDCGYCACCWSQHSSYAINNTLFRSFQGLSKSYELSLPSQGVSHVMLVCKHPMSLRSHMDTFFKLLRISLNSGSDCFEQQNSF